jgi:hypothetical protein
MIDEEQGLMVLYRTRVIYNFFCNIELRRTVRVTERFSPLICFVG